jgi:ribose 5-phosphate isomerase B
MLYIASDHGGYKLKEEIKKFLIKKSIEYTDLGPDHFDATDDYPDSAKKVAAQVSKNPKRDLGILLCRSGQGVNIVANKFKNVRAALVWNAKEAKASREDDLANVLSIPSDYVSSQTAKKVVQTWLSTSLGTAPRHLRRVKKIQSLEKTLMK